MGTNASYAVIFGVSAVASFLLTFPVRRLAERTGALAAPGDQHMHVKATPTVGGAAMLGAFALALLLGSRLGAFQGAFRGSSEPIGILLAAVVIYGVGLIDDVRDISAPAKVAGEVLAAMILVFLGVTMYYFKIPFVADPIVLSASVLPLITAVWVVGMTNSVNLIDGLDGLAAGIVAIASGSLAIYAIHLSSQNLLPPDSLGPLVAVATSGICVGFLPHNFHPAKIFMGDGGALLLGLLMAVSTMLVGGRVGTASGVAKDVSGLTFFRFAPLFVPFFILGVPLLDTMFALVRRTIRRSSFAERDLGHLHHRLVRLGHGHRRAVLILWAWTAVLSGFVLVPVFDPRANAVVPFGAAILGVGLYTFFRPAGRAQPVLDPTIALSSGSPAPVPALPEAEPTG
ncbi:MAG: wecA, partial [Acidimicrobiaceae bacterium]|nr:wecA [Acidimicrobiaceae bacterium]